MQSGWCTKFISHPSTISRHSTVCYSAQLKHGYKPKKRSIFHLCKHERVLLLMPQMLQLSNDLCSTWFCSLLLFIWRRKKKPPSLNLIKSDSNQNMTWVWTLNTEHNIIITYMSEIHTSHLMLWAHSCGRCACLTYFTHFPLNWSVHVNCKRTARSSDWCMMRILKMDFDMLNISCSTLDYLFIKLMISQMRLLLTICQRFIQHVCTHFFAHEIVYWNTKNISFMEMTFKSAMAGNKSFFGGRQIHFISNA